MSNKNIEAIYQLSPLQHGMLFHTLYDTDQQVYIVQMSGTLHEALDLAAFEQAWQQVVQRHAILRTAFVWHNRSEPLQVVGQQVRLPFQSLDWREADAAAQQARLEAFLAADREQGFNLAKAPLMRLTLIRRAESTYQFIWTYHHLLMDGWSMFLLLEEVFAIYAAGPEQARRLPPPRPFREYIHWLRQQDVARAEQFWRAQLGGFHTPTVLGIDCAPGARLPDGARYGEVERELSQTTTAALGRVAQEQRLTLNTLVQGAWAYALSRYSGSNDVVFGTTVAGRPPTLAGADRMIGLFINTLPVRATIDGRQPLLRWLQTLQQQLVDQREYEYSSLVQVQGWSQIPRGQPLFESIVVFENYPVQFMQGEGQRLALDDFRYFERTHYPLHLEVGGSAQLTLKAAFQEHRFAHDSIAALLAYVETLLASIAADPLRRVADLPALLNADRERLLISWNATGLDYPAHLGMHQLVETQAARTPQAVAVACGQVQLSYAVLEARANKLARYLRQLGVGSSVSAEVLVGVCLDRTVDLVVALLAILKAGGAYVPLDPTYPPERLRFMIEDSQLAVLLTQTDLLPALPPHPAQVVALDAEWERIAQLSPEPLAADVRPDQLAYVIYTSGSTGQPKGVMIAHRALVNFLSALQREPGLRATDNLLAVTTISFDIAGLELFLPLSAGARVILASREQAADGQQLAALLQPGVTLMQATPATWRMLLEAGWPGHPALTIFCGGEALPADLADQLRPRVAELWNMYGPTETTIWSALERVGAGPLTIGRPIANTQIYMLDRDGQLVPQGVPGELYIGGDGLARGYLRRPALTAERFVPDSYSGASGARLYGTGDLARFRADGTIEYLGRIDQQVKLRGYRIELGEIESVLREHPAVQAAAVVVHGQAADARLVAYIVAGISDQESGIREAGDAMGTLPPLASDLRSLAPGELRGFVQERLPGYMVPSAFVWLPELPLTLNGKLDRKMLAQRPPAAETPSGAGRAQARTPVQEILAGLWSEMLNVSQIGPDDSFFELGGHSLLATRLISQIRSTFQVELSVRTLFEQPTLAQLAEQVEQLHQQGASAAPGLVAVPRGQPLPLSFAQQQLWFLQQMAPDSSFYNVPAAVRLSGPLLVEALHRSINAVVQRHEVLRTTFEVVQDQPMQIEHSATSLPLPVVDLRELPPEQRLSQVQERLESEARQPFDLRRGPLLRATVYQLDAIEHVLALTLHHIVADGWSTGLLIQELTALYEAEVRQRAAALADLPVQYADFAVWQRQLLTGPTLERQLRFWTEQLADAPPLLALPTDYPRPAAQSFRSAQHSFDITPEVTQALAGLSQREGVTLFMTLLTAWSVLLHRYSGQADVLVGYPVAGRSHPSVESLIGCFINTLVLRADLGHDPLLRDMLHRTRERTLAAYAHQDLPFELLVNTLRPQRHPSYNPLFQVMFVFQQDSLPPLSCADLAVTPLDLDSGAAQFDLLLSLRSAGDGLTGTLTYSTDLFAPTTAAQLARHFQTLLSRLPEQLAQPVSQISLMSADEQQQVLAAAQRERAALLQRQIQSRLGQLAQTRREQRESRES